MRRSAMQSQRIEAMLDSVRIVPPTAETATRFSAYYQQAYRDDEDLFARVCDPQQGIDGLTERATPAEILRVLQMPDTVAFEVVSKDATSSGGFLIVSYASGERGSRDRFKKYFLGEVFQPEGLQFASRDEEATFLQLMERGYVAYFAEFVAVGGRVVSGPFILAAYQEICVRRHSGSPFTIFGKCLDSARIGNCTNLKGNRPVKAMAEALGLVKIALCDEVRKLRTPKCADLLHLAFPHEQSIPENVEAILSFALYRGSARHAVDALTARS
jgi:hypothetical protein